MSVTTEVTFYVDLFAGSDAARPTFQATNTGAFSDRFDSTTPHGLVVGAVVDYSGDMWEVWAVISPTAFRLRGFLGSLAPSPFPSTFSPRGGSSWADAWRTFTSGATSSRLAVTVPGGSVRILVRESDKIFLGNLTPVPGSSVLDLGAGRGHGVDWFVIDQCDTAWVGANAATSTTTTARRQGTAAVSVTKSSGGAINTKYAYKTLPALTDLSGYLGVALYTRTVSTTSATQWCLCLCSDTTGDVIVDSLPLPAHTLSATYYKTLVERTGGGNLGSNIRSVALYSGTSVPPTSAIFLDNIVAYKPGGLHHHTPLVFDTTSQGISSNFVMPIGAFNADSTLVFDGASGLTAPPGSGEAIWIMAATMPYATYYAQTLVAQRLPSLSATMTGFSLGAANYPVTVQAGVNTATNIASGITHVLSDATASGGILFSVSASGGAYYPKIRGFSTSYITSVISVTSTSTTNGVLEAHFPAIHATTGNVISHASTQVDERVLYIEHLNSVGGSPLLSVATATTGARTDHVDIRLGTCRFTSSGLFSVGLGCTLYLNFTYIGTTGTSSFVYCSGTAYINQGRPSVARLARHQGTLNPYSIGGSGRIHVDNTSTPVVEWNENLGLGRGWLLMRRRDGGQTTWWLGGGQRLLESASNRPGGTGRMWTCAGANFPYVLAYRTREGARRIPLATFVCNAAGDVTVKAWVFRRDAEVFLCVRRGSSALATSTPPSEELFSVPHPDPGIWRVDNGEWWEHRVTFTPTGAGVFFVDLVFWRTSSGGTPEMRIDTCTMEQV